MLPSSNSLEGKRVPDVTLKTRTDNQWKDVSTEEVGGVPFVVEG